MAEIKTINGMAIADTTARAEIETLKGSAPGLVFDTKLDMDAYIAENAASLNVGQDLYIRAENEPDYWWDGTAAVAVEAKTDLSGYATVEQVETKADLAVVPNVASVDGSTLKMQRKTTDEDGTETTSELFEVELPAGGGTGTVTSVNGVSPDASGNVEVEVGQPTDEQVSSAVSSWMAENPDATLQDGAVTTPKLANEAVNAEKISGMVLIPQPFDPETFTYELGNIDDYGAVDNTAWNGASNYRVSSFYSVKPNQLYTINFATRYENIACYDSDHNFIAKVAVADKQFTTADQTAFIRFDYLNNSGFNGEALQTYMICEGDMLYDHYFVGVEGDWTSMFRENTINGNKLKNESVHGNKLIPGTVDFVGLQGVTVLMQLFNQEDYINNGTAGGVIQTNGSILAGSSATYWCSDYVAAKSNQIYTCNWTPYTKGADDTVACYNIDKVFLGIVSLDGNKQFSTLDGTAYIRFGDRLDITTEKSAKYMICEGETLFSGYVPGGKKIVIEGILLDMSTPENSVDGSVLADDSVPMSKIKSDTALKILCLGDSLTQNKYPSILATILKADVTDAGIGGNTINQINSRVGNYGTDFDIVTLMCGTNDNGGQTSCPLGTIDDAAATDDNATATDTTYVSRLKRLLNTIKTTHPGATYILMPMFQHTWGDNLEEVANIMEDVARLYSIPYLDIYHLCGWRGTDEADAALWLTDGTHENDAGAQRIAELLAGFIKQLKGA